MRPGFLIGENETGVLCAVLCWGMARFSRGNYWIDGLALVGLVLIGAAVFLAAGLAATLGYAGGALLVVALVLAVVPAGRVQ